MHAANSLPPGAATRTTNNINNGPPNNSKVTALHNAAAYSPVEWFAIFLKPAPRSTRATAGIFHRCLCTGSEPIDRHNSDADRGRSGRQRA